MPGLVLVAAEPYGGGRACGAPRSAVHHNRRRGVPDCFGGIRTLASHVFSAFPDVMIRCGSQILAAGAVHQDGIRPPKQNPLMYLVCFSLSLCRPGCGTTEAAGGVRDNQGRWRGAGQPRPLAGPLPLVSLLVLLHLWCPTFPWLSNTLPLPWDPACPPVSLPLSPFLSFPFPTAPPGGWWLMAGGWWLPGP